MVVRSNRNAFPLSLKPCDSCMFVKENSDRKKMLSFHHWNWCTLKSIKKCFSQTRILTDSFLNTIDSVPSYIRALLKRTFYVLRCTSISLLEGKLYLRGIRTFYGGLAVICKIVNRMYRFDWKQYLSKYIFNIKIVYTIPLRGSYRKVANSADAKNVRKTIEHNFRNAQVVKERDEN